MLNAFIESAGSIESLTVGGSVIGGETRVLITAAEPLGANAVTIGGRVENADFVASYTGRHPVNPSAFVGPFKVAGDWIGSNLIAGAVNTAASGQNVNFGDLSDAIIPMPQPGHALIKSVNIRGQIRGTPDTGDHFGFVAQEIRSFTLGQTAIALTAGAGNDTIPLGLNQRHVRGLEFAAGDSNRGRPVAGFCGHDR